jgi:hypothetical protein
MPDPAGFVDPDMAGVLWLVAALLVACAIDWWLRRSGLPRRSDVLAALDLAVST